MYMSTNEDLCSQYVNAQLALGKVHWITVCLNLSYWSLRHRQLHVVSQSATT